MTTVSETNSASFKKHQPCQSGVIGSYEEVYVFFFFWIFGFTYHFLHHVHDFLLDQIKALSVACRRTADDIVDLDIIVFLANTTTVHSI